MLWNLLCTSLLQSCTCVEDSSLHHSKARSTQADKHTTSSLPILDFWWKRICPQLQKKFTSSCNCLNSVMARKEAMSGSFKIVLNLRSYCFSASLKAFEASTPSSLVSHPCNPNPISKLVIADANQIPLATSTRISNERCIHLRLWITQM
jgi:hypothetical protein